MSGYTIPNVVASHPRGDRIMDVYSHLLAERIVYLGTEVDAGVANAVIAQFAPRRRQPRPRRAVLDQLCRRRSERRPGDLRHDAAHPPPRDDHVRGAGPSAWGRCSSRRGRRDRGPRCRMPASCCTSRLPRRGERCPTSSSPPTRWCGCVPKWSRSCPPTPGGMPRCPRADTDRDRVFTAQAAVEYACSTRCWAQADRSGRRGRERLRPQAARAKAPPPVVPDAGAPAACRPEATALVSSKQRQVERAGDRGDHLARRVFEPPLDLRQILWRDAGGIQGLGQRVTARMTATAQLGADPLAPQGLGSARRAGTGRTISPWVTVGTVGRRVPAVPL